MGCGGSRLGGVAAVRAEGAGVVPLPAGIRPLLRRRLEEMKKRSHASVLKGKQTLSKKELLRHGSSEDGEETEENDGSLKSSAKVAPAPDHHVEEKKDVIYEKDVSSKDDVKEVEEEVVKIEKEEDVLKKQKEEEVVEKQKEENDHQEVVKKQKEEEDEVVKKQKEENDHQEVVKKQEEEPHHDDEAINVKKEGDVDIKHDESQGTMNIYDERMIGPGSPSFRVYCIDVASDDDEDQKDGDEDTRKSTEIESVTTTETKEDESIVVKKEKRDRRGKRFGIALPRKYLANVTAPCYAGGGCMGNTHSRLVQEKSSQ